MTARSLVAVDRSFDRDEQVVRKSKVLLPRHKSGGSGGNLNEPPLLNLKWQLARNHPSGLTNRADQYHYRLARQGANHH